MKIVLLFVFSLLVLPNPTLATDLDEFYSWKFRKICETPSAESSCYKNWGKVRVMLLSGEKDTYFMSNPTSHFSQYIATCKVKVVEDRRTSDARELGKTRYVTCGQTQNQYYGKNNEWVHGKIFNNELITNYDNKLSTVFDIAKKDRNQKILEQLSSDFSHHKVSLQAQNAINERNSSQDKQRESAISEYKKAKSIQQKIELLTKVNDKKKVPSGWVKYSDVIDDNMVDKFVADIFNSVKKENNISGYNWFIKNYPSSKQAKQALTKMHKLAFEIADDIDTINAYNDFVIAYPTAKQVREANERAYELEKSEFVGMFNYFSEEKDARRLLVQSKMLEQSAEDLSSDEKVGYMMVVNRMNDLLKQEFNSTDAALRHLESNEFKSFVRTFKRSMKDLKRQVSRIADNTEDLSSIMKNQSKMMNNHFEDAAQDREMASELTKQHRHWERFIGEVGL